MARVSSIIKAMIVAAITEKITEEIISGVLRFFLSSVFSFGTLTNLTIDTVSHTVMAVGGKKNNITQKRSEIIPKMLIILPFLLTR